uniref:Non-structural maintenance of chromosomes element 4 n=1 Tax=Hirondellea gigas TaxID=1518452 RepID=A0A2P2I9A4_9CRUS
MQQGGSRGMSEQDYEDQRQKYRELLEELQEKADSSGAQGVDPDVLRILMLQGNQLFLNVRRPREAALDAQFMKQVSQLATLNIRSTHASLHEFKPLEFAAKIKTFLNGEQTRLDHGLSEDNWKKLGRMSSKAFRPCYGLEPQFTGFVSKAPKPAVRVPRVKDKEVARTDLRQISSAEEEEVQTEEVSRIYSVLKKRFKENGNRPVCFYSFVVNPHSFVLTIENVFHTSFLIRDQHALIAEDSNGLPVIAPDKPTSGGSSLNSKQTEISFDVSTYNECIKVFNIKHPMIPPRTTHHNAS